MSTEAPARLPGYTLIRTGKSNRYRTPSGEEIGDWKYRQLYREYKRTGVAPPSSTSEKHQYPGTFSHHDSSTNEPPGTILDFDEPTGNEPTKLSNIELPKSKSTPSTKRKEGHYSSSQLSNGLSSILVIITSMLAVVSKLPEAQMNDLEVKAICIPLANILERSRYNQSIGTMVVGKSDYILLGYALYVYIERVARATRERSGEQLSQPPRNTSPIAEPSAGYDGRVAGGAALHNPPRGLRGFTPLT